MVGGWVFAPAEFGARRVVQTNAEEYVREVTREDESALGDGSAYWPAHGTRRRGIKSAALVAFCLVLLIASGTYFACLHKFDLTYEHEGWTFRMTRYGLRCLHCTGRIKRLEYRGHPLQLPPVPNNEAFDELYVWTPVGTFEWYGSEGWLAIMSPGRNALNPTLPAVTSAELARGYYDLPVSEYAWRVSRAGRRGTPPYWYSLSSSEFTRWIDPVRMEEFSDWPTMQPPTTTAPADAPNIPKLSVEP